MDQVHLTDIAGQGHAITLQALGVPNGTAGQLASPKLLTVEGTVATAGGDLSILNMQAIEVNSGEVVTTRDIGSGTDYLNAPSAGNSGKLKLTAENPDVFNPLLNIAFNHPHITVGAGAGILAQADGVYAPGDVTLTATNINYTLDGLTFPSLADTVRSADITFADATVGSGAVLVKGGAITVTATSGDSPLNTLLGSQGKNASNSWQS